jgi:hypothetical protein
MVTTSYFFFNLKQAYITIMIIATRCAKMNRFLILISIAEESQFIYTLIKNTLTNFEYKSQLGFSHSLCDENDLISLEELHDYCFIQALENVLESQFVGSIYRHELMQYFYDEHVKNSIIPLCYRLIDHHKLFYLKHVRHVKVLITSHELILSHTYRGNT